MTTPTTSMAEHANRDASDTQVNDWEEEEFGVIEEPADASELALQVI